MNDLIIVSPPPPNGKIAGAWYNGYTLHQGRSEESLNFATLYSQKHNIIPDQEELTADWTNFSQTLLDIGFDLNIIDFPDELNQLNSLYHDAIFVRDAGFMYNNYWVQARFSAKNREKESQVMAKIIEDTFDKEIISLPENAFLEFGEVIYKRTEEGSFYFGGLSRANALGHEFMRKALQPDHFLLIKSEGYHLDTLFTPVISPENTIAAIVTATQMLHPDSLKAILSLNIPIIAIDAIDSSGEGEEIGNYAVNALTAPGIMVTCSEFSTPGVEQELMEMGIEHYITPLTYFRFAGGSCHCLTNEIHR